MPTITDVSKKAGVSRSTVSRLIAGNGYVSGPARRAVEAAIAELGYRPNTMARGLRSNRSHIIGAVVVDVASPFYAQMVGGMQQGGRAHGKSTLVASGYAQREDEAHAILELIDRACDGLILYLETPLREDVVEIVRNSAIPVVVIGGDECPVATLTIHIDNFGGARDAMRHLLQLGHRDIAYLSGGLMYRDTRERVRGIEAALAEAGMRLDDLYLEHGDFNESFGLDAAPRLLATGRPVTAIMAGDDDIAAGVLFALKQAGRSVPDDISLVGFDDNFHARHLTPALTTVRQPVHAVGHLAADLLSRVLAGEAVPSTEITVPTELVVRDSTAVPAKPGARRKAVELTR